MNARTADELLLITHPRFNRDAGVIAGGKVAITPNIADNIAFRVQLTDNQALIGFPKFGTIGVGFEVEDDWNTNLPYSTHSKLLLDHISHNRTAGGDDDIDRDVALVALELIREAAGALPEYGKVCTACRTPRVKAWRELGTAGGSYTDPGDDHWVDGCTVSDPDTGSAFRLAQYDDVRLPTGWPDKTRSLD